MQASDITIMDGQATPSAKTFVVFSGQQGTSPAVYYEKSAGSLAGYRRITLSLILNANGVTKVKAVISDPILASVQAGCCVDTTTPQVSYTDFFNGEFSLARASTTSNRKDILAYAKNLMSHAVMASLVVDGNPQL